MNTKTLPSIIALIAGFFICILAFVTKMNMEQFAISFIWVILGFYLFGYVIKLVLDKSATAKEKEEEESMEEDSEEGDSAEKGSEAASSEEESKEDGENS